MKHFIRLIGFFILTSQWVALAAPLGLDLRAAASGSGTSTPHANSLPSVGDVKTLKSMDVRLNNGTKDSATFGGGKTLTHPVVVLTKPNKDGDVHIAQAGSSTPPAGRPTEPDHKYGIPQKIDKNTGKPVAGYVDVGVAKITSVDKLTPFKPNPNANIGHENVKNLLKTINVNHHNAGVSPLPESPTSATSHRRAILEKANTW